MKHVQHLQLVIALGLCACLAGPALAITDGITSQGLPYVTGGISDDERDALAGSGVPHGLRIVTVARESGAYLADARIVIADANGRRLLDTRLDGPFLQVALAPGRYTISAEFERQSMSKEISVAREVPRQLVFAFDADVDSVPGTRPG